MLCLFSASTIEQDQKSRVIYNHMCVYIYQYIQRARLDLFLTGDRAEEED